MTHKLPHLKFKLAFKNSLSLGICQCPYQSVSTFSCLFPRTCWISSAAFSTSETLSLEKGRREKLISPPSLRSTILRRSEQVLLVFLGVQICSKSHIEVQPRTDVLLFSSCWLLMALPLGRHSLTRNSQPKEKRSHINREIDVGEVLFFFGLAIKWMFLSQMISPLSFEQAVSARDALAKAVYGRTFTWLVEKINQSLAPKVHFWCDVAALLTCLACMF